MKISTLKIECDKEETTVTVWVNCSTKEEVDDVIAWLQLAKSVMNKWEKINSRAAQPDHSPILQLPAGNGGGK